MNALVRSAWAGVIGVATAFVGCASSGVGTPADNPAISVSKQPISAPTATLIVHGMSCPLCAHNVDKQLKEVPGVRSVNVDMSSGEVKVGLADVDRPSTAQLKRAIDGSGFTLKDIRVP